MSSSLAPNPELQHDPLLAHLPLSDGFRLLDRRYLIYELVGQGGMGVVYKARHGELGVDVAIKCLDPGLARRNAEFVKRFKNEARAAARLSSANVVRVLDVAEQGSLHFLAMEFVEGEDARRRIARKGALEIDEGVRIALGAARGLAAAHAAGIVHRDVKPDNVLIGTDGQVKIADLGLAKQSLDQTELTRTGATLGTPRYMAPEQFSDTKNVGPEGDVYALGATLYFLLVGRDAIAEKEIWEIAEAVRTRAFPDPRELRPQVPTALAELVLNCTRKQPSERPREAGEVARRLEALLMPEGAGLADPEAGQTSAASLVSPPPHAAGPNEEVTRAARQAPATPLAGGARGWRGLLLLALLLVGFSGTAAWFLRDRHPNDPSPPAGASAPALLTVTPPEGTPVDGLRLSLVLEFDQDLERASLRGNPVRAEGNLLRLELPLPAQESEWELPWEVENAAGQRREGRLSYRRPAPPPPPTLQLVEPELEGREAHYTSEPLIEIQVRVGAPRSDRIEIRRADGFRFSSALAPSQPQRIELALVQNARNTFLLSTEGVAQPLELVVVHDDREPRLLLSASLRAERPRRDAHFELRVVVDEPNLAQIRLGERELEQVEGREYALRGIPLHEGANEFELVARDLLGQESRLAFELTRDSTAPHLIEGVPPAPLPARIGVALELALRFDEELSSASLDGVALAVEGERASGSLPIHAPAGERTARLRFADLAGNEATHEVRLAVEDVPRPRDRTLPGYTIVQAAQREGQPAQEPGAGAEAGWPWWIEHTATGIQFLLVEPGQFLQGAAAGERGALEDERPQHPVEVTRAFYLARTEVTQAQWARAEQENPSLFEGEANRPVEQVSWIDCDAFARRFGWELPSEAQWEYACRAGTRTPFSSGHAPPARENVGRGLERGSTAPVASAAPNPWGFHDMHGNVFEWCRDWYDPSFYVAADQALRDPWNDQEIPNVLFAPFQGSARVLRGGSYGYGDEIARSSRRGFMSPSFRFRDLGLRPLLPLPRD